MPRSKEPITVETVASVKPRSSDWIMWDGGDGAVKGLGLKITPTGKKIYILKYRMAGGRAAPTRRFTIGDSGGWTPKTARIKARALLSQISDGQDPMLEKQRERVGTIKALIADYIKAFEQDGERDAGEGGRILNRIIVPAWGNRATASISKVDVRHLVKGIHRRGAAVMANRTLSVVKRLFAYAVENDLVEFHPCPTMKPLTVEQSRHRTLSDAELVEVWQAADALGWPFGEAVKLMILSGQRREEVGGMAKAEIDRAKGLWSLPPERTKNKQPHDVHLTPQMLEVLDALPNVSKQLYFTTTGKTPVSGWSRAKTQIDTKILEARREAAKKAGEEPDQVQPMPGWIFHDLRRTMTTKLNELGVSEKVADILINHRSRKKGGVAAVYNRYQYMAERKAALEAWGRHFDELLSGDKPGLTNELMPAMARG
jgi:integrase